MAKDPAFLFYSSDFYMGTVGLTDAQVGQYIRLMCLQHAKGHLSESLMTSTMGGEFDEAVACKFLVDENRCYYNERLDEESKKRNSYTDSRRKNLSTSPTHMQEHMEQHMQEHSDSHMGQHMENENITINTVPNKPKKGVTGGHKHKCGMYQNVFLTDAEMTTLKEEFPDWADRIDNLSEGIETKGYKYKNHLATIRAWARKDGENGSKRNSSGNAGNGHGTGQGGADDSGDGDDYSQLETIRC